MAKKVRFPLEMRDGVMVRTLQELMENFDLEKAVSYMKEGKLETWLRDRLCGSMADDIQKLDATDQKIGEKVCRIIFSPDNGAAFEQDGLDSLLEAGRDKLYLFGGDGTEFEIPLEKEGITYIGLNHPVIRVNSGEPVDWKEKNIRIEGCTFDEGYAATLEERKKEMGFSDEESRKYYKEIIEKNPGKVWHSYEELEAEARKIFGSYLMFSVCPWKLPLPTETHARFSAVDRETGNGRQEA